MAFKQYNMPDVGEITVYKRRGSRSMRLSVAADGKIRLTIPTYVPFQAGVAFAESRKAWLQSQTVTRVQALQNSQAIGKNHSLSLIINFKADKPTARNVGSEIRVSYPSNLTAGSPEVQAVAQRACIRALRDEAESLLPGRLAEIASTQGFDYKSVSIKRLKGRWGSCDQDNNIVLNLFLMQLPWELIDYVLLHELIHTKHLHHGPDFWASFLSHEPRAKLLRKQIRRYQPSLATLEG